MHHSISRRGFLQTSTGIALSTGLLAMHGRARAAEGTSPLPIACRDTLLRAAGAPDAWSAMKKLGVTGIELEVTENLDCSALFHPEKRYTLATPEGVNELRRGLDENQFKITAFCMHNRFDERLEQELASIEKLVKIGQALGVTVVRIDVVPRKIEPDAFLPFAVKACTEICRRTEGSPLRFGIENHGSITNRPEFLEKLFEGVGSARLGLTLDAANFYWFGHPLKDLYGIYEKFAARAFHTHCKSIKYPEGRRDERRRMGWEYERYTAPVYDGDIDFARVVKILRAAKYTGDLCLENECLGKFPAGEQAEVLKKEIAFLRGLA
jgi:sugar phosphate isomerase/epimerase